MTDLRQAAQMALKALEELDGLDTETECVTIDVGDVIDALRTALEQQAEPVAVKHGVIFLMHGEKMAFKIGTQQFLLDYEPTEPGEFEFMKHCLNKAFNHFTPSVKNDFAAQQAEPVAFYTTPPQRKPLTASEILDMMPSTILAEYDGPLMEFARAVEVKLKERNGY